MGMSGVQSYGTPPMQPSVDEAPAAPNQGTGVKGGVKALADKFMSSGTSFSPNAAIAATASASIANASVREAIAAVHIESSYMTNMVQNLRGGYGSYGAGTMAMRNAGSFGSRYGVMSTRSAGIMGSRSYGGARTMGMFNGPGAFTTGSEAFSHGIQAMKSGLKANIGIGAAIGAVMSLVQNISGVAKGTISKGEAAGNVATDTVSSGISAAGGAILGGVATAALGAVGIAGLPLTLLGLGAGLLGGVVTDGWFRKTKIAESIHNMVAQAFSK